MTSWISLHIMHTMLFVESLSHHQEDIFLQLSSSISIKCKWMERNKKLRKWKLKNFIKLVSAINYKIYVFKGDIHKTLVNVVPLQKSHRNSQAHEKCLMSRTWTENEWKFNGIYIITVLHSLFTPFLLFLSISFVFWLIRS